MASSRVLDEVSDEGELQQSENVMMELNVAIDLSPEESAIDVHPTDTDKHGQTYTAVIQESGDSRFNQVVLLNFTINYNT